MEPLKIKKGAVHIGLQGKFRKKEMIVVAFTECIKRSTGPKEHEIPEQVRVRYLEEEKFGGYETVGMEEFLEHYSLRLQCKSLVIPVRVRSRWKPTNCGKRSSKP